MATSSSGTVIAWIHPERNYEATVMVFASKRANQDVARALSFAIGWFSELRCKMCCFKAQSRPVI